MRTVRRALLVVVFWVLQATVIDEGRTIHADKVLLPAGQGIREKPHFDKRRAGQYLILLQAALAWHPSQPSQPKNSKKRLLIACNSYLSLGL